MLDAGEVGAGALRGSRLVTRQGACIITRERAQIAHPLVQRHRVGGAELERRVEVIQCVPEGEHGRRVLGGDHVLLGGGGVVAGEPQV